MSSEEASKMLRTYNIAWWGNNYYDVNELGHISVCPDPDVPEARVDLAKLVKTREAQGQRLPALFCFPQILQHRLRSINAAFNARGNRMVITATISSFTRSRSTSTVA
ncbi:Biosynthetic arginine decarboxylase [Enterobacter hormaechei]|nr:Biosynthetic arginine decarboxylase [Enterobacter hormaechei]